MSKTPVRLEAWTGIRAEGGVCVAHIPDMIDGDEAINVITGEDTLKLVLPADSPAAGQLAENRVISVVYSDWSRYERRIARIQLARGRGERRMTVTARGLRGDLAVRTLVSRFDAAGVELFQFEMPSLPRSQHLALVVASLHRAGQRWWQVGTVDQDDVITVVYDKDTPAQAVGKIAQDLEVQIRPVGTTAVAIDLLARIGATAPMVYARTNKNLLDVAIETGVDDVANVVTPFGAPDLTGAKSTMQGARWEIFALSGSAGLVLRDPTQVAAGPIAFDDQLNGLALTWPGALSGSFPLAIRVLDSVAATQTVVLEDRDYAALVAGGEVMFRRHYPDMPGAAELFPVDGTAESLATGVQAGWTGSAGAPDLHVLIDSPHSGTKHFSMTNATELNSYRSRDVTVEAGKVYRLRVWVTQIGLTTSSSEDAPPGAGVEIWSSGAAVTFQVRYANAPYYRLGASRDTVFVGKVVGDVETYRLIELVIAPDQSGTLHIGFELGYSPNNPVAGIGRWDDASFREVEDIAADLASLSDPISVALYGPRVGHIERSDLVGAVNLARNPAFRQWQQVPPSLQVPGGVQPTWWRPPAQGYIARNVDPRYWQSGGYSLYYLAPATITPLCYFECEPAVYSASSGRVYLSMGARVFVLRGTMTVEIVCQTVTGWKATTGQLPGSAMGAGDAEYVFPRMGGKNLIINTEVNRWQEFRLNAFDLINYNKGTVRLRFRAVEPSTEFYLDFAQMEPAQQLSAFVEGAGGTRLWQATNVELNKYSKLAIGTTGDLLDLTTVAGDRFPYSAIEPGGRIQLSVPELDFEMQTRILGLRRSIPRKLVVGTDVSKRQLGITRLLARRGGAERSDALSPPPILPPDPIGIQGALPGAVGAINLTAYTFGDFIVRSDGSIQVTGNTQILVVAPAPDTARYRLFRRPGDYPTTTRLPTGSPDQNYFVCERSVDKLGGGVLANGQGCPGGRGDVTNILYPNIDPNVLKNIATGTSYYYAVVPIDKYGRVGPTAYASVQSTGQWQNTGGINQIYVQDGTRSFGGVPDHVSRPGDIRLAWGTVGGGNATDYAAIDESVNGGPWRQVYRWTNPDAGPWELEGLGQGYLPGITGDEQEVTWVYRMGIWRASGLTVGVATTDPVTYRAIPIATKG